jgi:hypothetical protein
MWTHLYVVTKIQICTPCKEKLHKSVIGWYVRLFSKESLYSLTSNVLQTPSHALADASLQYNRRQVSTLIETPASTIEALATEK